MWKLNRTWLAYKCDKAYHKNHNDFFVFHLDDVRELHVMRGKLIDGYCVYLASSIDKSKWQLLFITNSLIKFLLIKKLL